MTVAAVQKQKEATFSQKHITRVKDLSISDITAILDLAKHYKNERTPQKILENKVILNLFLENSTRTRVSFEMAALRLGARVINVTADGSSVKKGENLDDTLRTLAAIAPDALVIRHGENGAAQKASEIFECPVLNGGDGTNEHPTQALLDAFTLREKFGSLDGLAVVICGDIKHSRVARSNFHLLTKMGVIVRLTGHAELLPSDLPTVSDMREAFKDADAVMMLRLQKERMEKTLSMTEGEYFKRYGLDAEKLGWAKPDAVVLHPGPMNRGVEIDGVIADDPKRSLVLDQVSNGVFIRMACLDLLLRT